MLLLFAVFSIFTLATHSTVAHQDVPDIPTEAFQSNPPRVDLLPGTPINDERRLKGRQVRGTGLRTLYYAGQTYNVLATVGNYNFQLSLDTASSDAWMVSTRCNTPQCRDLPEYPESHYSSTFTSVNNNLTEFRVSFQDETSASGFVARERFSLAGFQLDNQAFGLANSSNVTLAPEVSGVLGLGFPRLSTIAGDVQDASPFIVRLAQQGLLSYPLFALSLQRNNSGTMTLGAIDSSVVSNVTSIRWNRVVPFGEFEQPTNASVYLQWALHLSNVTVNGSGTPLIPTYPNITGPTSVALIDVGVNGIYGPYQDVANIYSRIPNSRFVGDGTWAVPCDSVYNMTFSIGGRNYTIGLTDLIAAQLEGNPNMCLTWPSASSPSADGIDWQLGIPFLRSVYTVFSFGVNGKEPPLIGFAPLRNNSAPVETPGQVASFLSSASLWMPSTLPNVLLPTPTYTTPPYIFNTSISTPSMLDSSAIGASSYSPLITQSTITRLPTIAPTPIITVVTMTNDNGLAYVTTSVVPTSSVVLGLPEANSASYQKLALSPRLALALVMFSLSFSWTF